MSQKNPIGFLEDSNGDKSSKRLWGSILLAISIVLTCFLFFISIYKSDTVTAIKTLEFLFVSGAGLLGIGVFEGWVRK